MANQEHLEILRQGVNVWNRWREEHKEKHPNLSYADLARANLSKANLSYADLSHSTFEEATLVEANLFGADLSYANLERTFFNRADLRHANLTSTLLNGAKLYEADLTFADLSRAFLMKADLRKATLYGAELEYATLHEATLGEVNLSRAILRNALFYRAAIYRANLSEATLSGADLGGAMLTDTNLQGANLTNCSVYGIAVWNVELKGARQNNLIITPPGEPKITVDNLEVAQFIYLLLNNPKIRDVIDTVAKKAVLILGRFTPERKAVLDALREALREQGYLPILFDFDKPNSQDLTETVSTLAHLSRFIIVDLSDPSSTPYEVGTIASNHIKPIQAIFHPSETAKRIFAMFPDLLMRYHWVLPPYEYQGQEQLLASLKEHVIEPAERKAKELARLRAQEFEK